MSQTHITVKLDTKLKELFSRLCEEEGIDISQGTRELITEALARGYIVKERKDRLQKIKGGVNA
jgi:antitoxin component of RelBE/YafQ-DinJ toxin-antitoxin module